MEAIEREWTSETDEVGTACDTEYIESLVSDSDDPMGECGEESDAVSEEPCLQSLENSAVSCMAAVECELRSEDEKEEILVSSFFEEGCGCSKWEGKNCVNQFSLVHVRDVSIAVL